MDTVEKIMILLCYIIFPKRLVLKADFLGGIFFVKGSFFELLILNIEAYIVFV